MVCYCTHDNCNGMFSCFALAAILDVTLYSVQYLLGYIGFIAFQRKGYHWFGTIQLIELNREELGPNSFVIPSRWGFIQKHGAFVIWCMSLLVIIMFLLVTKYLQLMKWKWAQFTLANLWQTSVIPLWTTLNPFNHSFFLSI